MNQSNGIGGENPHKRARISRPWDRKRDRAAAAKDRFLKRQDVVTYGDFIDVKGSRFYSDRFYLNRTLPEDDHGEADDKESIEYANSGMGRDCTCGARKPPPLFDRSALVASLDLNAAILATYTVDQRSLLHEFPTLFGENATVPTLVLHGRNLGSDHEDKEAVDNGHDEEESPPQDFHIIAQQHSSSSKVEESLDGLSVGTQTSETKEYASSWNQTQSPTPCHKVSSTLSFPPQVHFTEIVSYWLSPSDLPSTVLKPDGSVCDTIVEKRKYKKGVHHPKFMILFETSGSVVVVVSTANLTAPHTIDGSWVQRFAPTRPDPTKNHSLKLHGDLVDETCCPGRVLGYFMDCQTWAAQCNQLTPLGFGRQYLGWKTQSCQELSGYYDFSKSHVFLVPHVPGDHPCDMTKSKSATTFRYGRNFVSHILHRLSVDWEEGCSDNTNVATTTRPWLPSSLLSGQDRLIIQPTSFGGQWTPKSMADVVDSYIGARVEDGDQDDDDTREKTLNQLDIVWPTDDFIRAIYKSSSRSTDPTRSGSPNSVVVQTGFLQQVETKKINDAAESTRANQGYLFMSSDTFNSIHIDCLSRMVMFEPSTPPQIKSMHIPHFKSVSRLFCGKRYRIQKDFGMGKSDEYFPWFLLTSACLSRGAQGIETDGPDVVIPGKQKRVSFTNFELGVLFCSRLQGKPKSDRLYCFKPACCSCPSESTQQQRPQLVHLPIPYDLRPASYHEDADDLLFCETPYFNEIAIGTITTGHMKLTPLGSSLAK
ncbi:hypothetical protein ACA910_008557 [Epithemia clementina (nom. ined.)]